MSNRMPSMLALLGLVAVAGYQHRDRLQAILKEAGARGEAEGKSFRQPGAAAAGAGQAEGGNFLSDVAAAFTGGDAGAALSDAVVAIVRTLKGDRERDAADTWVANGPNQPLAAADLRDRLGPALVSELARRTGLDESTLVERLADALPDTIDRFTPQGRLPSAEDAERLL